MANPAGFKAGDTARLKTDGPDTTVEHIVKDGFY